MQTISADAFKQRYGAQGSAVFQPTPQPSGGIGDSISNAFKGGITQMQQGYQQAKTATNPLQALGGGMKELAGGINTAFSPLAPATDFIGKGVQAVANPLSETPLIKGAAGNLVQKDGVTQYDANKSADSLPDFLADTSTVLGTVAAGGLKPKTQATPASKPIFRYTPPTPGGGGAATAPVRAAGRALKSAGEAAYGLTITPEKSTAIRMLNYDAKQPNMLGRIKNTLSGEGEGVKPTTEANTAARNGLVGTEYQLGVQAKQVAGKLWKDTIEPKLDAVKGKTNMKDFLGSVEKKLKTSEGDLTRRRVLMEALDVVKQDYKNVSDINLKKLQNYKSEWAKFVPDSSYNGKPIASAIKEVHDAMAAKAREVIYRNIGEEGKQAYIDHGNLQSIIESGIKSTLGDPASKSLGRDVWQMVMNKAITPVATVAGKVLYKTGEGMEFLGGKGAKTVGDVVGETAPSVAPKI